MKIVKQDKSLKTIWAAGRRAITPKVGQLTNDADVILRVVHTILLFSEPHHMLTWCVAVARDRQYHPSLTGASSTCIPRALIVSREGHPHASGD